jgi:hypothetical protein
LGAVIVGLIPLLSELLPPVGAPPQPGSPQPSDEVRLISTSKQSELIRSVKVSRTRRASERVAMSIPPGRLGPLRTDDQLDISAEVQVSTTCAERGRRCIGRRYDFDPIVTARLVLSNRGKEGVHGAPLSGRERIVCAQRRPDRNHHCPFTVVGGRAGTGGSGPACAPDRCHVNLVVGAHHRRAVPGHRIVLGGDRPSGKVVQDKGRLNVIRVPDANTARSEVRVGAPLHGSLPIRPPEGTRRRVVYSVAVPELRAGEVLAADGRFETRIGKLRYNAFVSSRLILATRPGAVSAPGAVRDVASHGGLMAEHNGFNCTQGSSGFKTPCITRKAGAARIVNDAVDDAGVPLTLYVNLVASARPRLGRARDFHRAILAPAGGLDVVRYGAG